MPKADDVIRRWDSARRNRGVWDQHWDDLARVMLPRRRGFTSSLTAGEQRTEDIFDGTPMQAARGLANAIAGFQWPEGEQSFHIRPDDPSIETDDEANTWLAEAGETLLDLMDNPRARWRQARGECDLDLVVFGTSVMYIGETDDQSNLLFQSVHLKDASVIWSEDGEPQGLFRRRRFTIRQAVQKFKLDNLSKETREKAATDKGLDEHIDILHAVTMRDEGRKGALMSKDMPFADMWIEIKAKHTVSEGGYREFPFVVPRWDTSSGEDYGRSPGMIALPDSNTLQAMGETMLVAGQRAADPPLMAPNDGSFSEVNSFPGGLSYYDVETAAQVRGNPFFPLESGANMPLTRDMQLDMRDQIFRAFFRNVLNLPIEGPSMTATEVIQRKEEFIREIGPVFGRLETDYKGPMVERAFNVALRGGAFGLIPDVLKGRNVRFEYESPVKKIRAQVQASAARMWAMEMMEYAAVDPGAADIVNIDALGRFSHGALGLPPEIINSKEIVQQRAESRAEAQAQANEMAMIQQGAEIADKGASAISRATEAA